MAERLLRAQPVSVANHVKARQTLIERNLINLRFTYLCVLYVRSTYKVNVLCIKFSDLLAYFMH